jgi:FG-GAP repeat/Divergent InlB B-repeat domain
VAAVSNRPAQDINSHQEDGAPQKTNTMKTKLLALALAASSLLPAQAIEPGKSQTLSSPDQVPEGLSASDWSSIRSAYSSGHTAKAAGVTSQQAYVKASNTGLDDNFGTSVAVSGDTVVVGAPYEDSSTTGVNSVPNEAASNSGAAYVFVRSSGVWSQQAYLKASNTGVDDRFGLSVAISGDTIIVGASNEASNAVGINGNQADNSADGSGAAYVFTRSGVTWSQQAYLKASTPGEYDQFGISVAVTGDTVVVGANAEDSSTTGVNSVANEAASNSGAAYVFVRSSGNWSQQGYLKASNTESGDFFGYSVAISGETIVVAAYLEDGNAVGVNGNQTSNGAAESGAAYIFVRSTGNWSQQAYLKASNTESSDSFGYSVAISGETIVVGAVREDSVAAGINGNQADNSATQSGAAYVFVRSGGTWSQQAYLKASNTELGDFFGYSVAISGETIVVGANQEASNAVGVNGNQADNGATQSGAAYAFVRSSGAWSQQAYLKASNTGAGDIFGISVAVSSGTVISGAYQEDSITTGINSVPNDTGTADNSGAAYIFSLPVAEPPAVVSYLIKVKVSKAKFGKVTGAGSFATGSSVTLKAKAKKGRQFVGWFEKKKLITKKKVLVIKALSKNRSLVAKFK